MKNLAVRDLRVNWTEDRPAYFTEAFVCEQSDGLSVDGFWGRQASTSGSAMRLSRGSHLSLNRVSAAPGTDVLLTARQISGPVAVRWGDVRNARRLADAPGLSIPSN